MGRTIFLKMLSSRYSFTTPIAPMAASCNDSNTARLILEVYAQLSIRIHPCIDSAIHSNPSTHVAVYPFIHQEICPSVFPFACVSICHWFSHSLIQSHPSIHSSIHSSKATIHQFTHPYARLFSHPSAYALTITINVSQPIRLSSIRLFTSPPVQSSTHPSNATHSPV